METFKGIYQEIRENEENKQVEGKSLQVEDILEMAEHLLQKQIEQIGRPFMFVGSAEQIRQLRELEERFNNKNKQ